MPKSANEGPLAGFIAHTGIETPNEPLFKTSLFGYRFLCPACTKPLGHPHIIGRMHWECQHCRRGYAIEMYPPRREPLTPGNSHTFTHMFYVAVSRREYQRFEDRLGKLEPGDAANNRPQMERAFLRKLGALEIFDAGPPPDAPQSAEEHERDYQKFLRQQNALRELNGDIIEHLQQGAIMKKVPKAPKSAQSPEHLRNREQ